MNFRQITAFRAVVGCGSMTAAARAIGISQPNVTRLISALEASTGLLLFDRKGGRLRATAEGIAFYSEVERLFSGLDGLRQAANDIRLSGQGSLRIAATFSYAGGFLPRVIATLRSRYPAVSIALQLRSSATILQWAAAQQCDVGIAWNVPPVPEVDVEPLLEFPGVCLLPNGHPLARRSIIRPEDLAGEPFISFPPDDAMRRRIDSAFESNGVSRLLIVETQYSAAIYALVSRGVGVSIANPMPLREYSPGALLARRFEPEILLTSSTLRPRQRTANRAADAFVEVLRGQMKEELAFFHGVLKLKRTSAIRRSGP